MLLRNVIELFLIGICRKCEEELFGTSPSDLCQRQKCNIFVIVRGMRRQASSLQIFISFYVR